MAALASCGQRYISVLLAVLVLISPELAWADRPASAAAKGHAGGKTGDPQLAPSSPGGTEEEAAPEKAVNAGSGESAVLAPPGSAEGADAAAGEPIIPGDVTIPGAQVSSDLATAPATANSGASANASQGTPEAVSEDALQKAGSETGASIEAAQGEAGGSNVKAEVREDAGGATGGKVAAAQDASVEAATGADAVQDASGELMAKENAGTASRVENMASQGAAGQVAAGAKLSEGAGAALGAEAMALQGASGKLAAGAGAAQGAKVGVMANTAEQAAAYAAINAAAKAGAKEAAEAATLESQQQAAVEVTAEALKAADAESATMEDAGMAGMRAEADAEQGIQASADAEIEARFAYGVFENMNPCAGWCVTCQGAGPNVRDSKIYIHRRHENPQGGVSGEVYTQAVRAPRILGGEKPSGTPKDAGPASPIATATLAAGKEAEKYYLGVKPQDCNHNEFRYFQADGSRVQFNPWFFAAKNDFDKAEQCRSAIESDNMAGNEAMLSCLKDEFLCGGSTASYSAEPITGDKREAQCIGHMTAGTPAMPNKPASKAAVKDMKNMVNDLVGDLNSLTPGKPAKSAKP